MNGRDRGGGSNGKEERRRKGEEVRVKESDCHKGERGEDRKNLLVRVV